LELALLVAPTGREPCRKPRPCLQRLRWEQPSPTPDRPSPTNEGDP
jgi:hypothetical protein